MKDYSVNVHIYEGSYRGELLVKEKIVNSSDFISKGSKSFKVNTVEFWALSALKDYLSGQDKKVAKARYFSHIGITNIK